MRIGDKIKFLNQVGGGIVVGFDKKGLALIEDEDGFQMPMPVGECIVVEENVVEKEGKSIQTKDGEKLNIALIYTQKGDGFVCTLANESNYSLFANYIVNIQGDYATLFAGELLPYEKKEIIFISKKQLNEFGKKVIIRCIPFKKSSISNKIARHLLKPIIDKDFILEPLNLLKDNLYKENEYISQRGIVYVVVNENVKELPLSAEIKEDETLLALKEKFSADSKGIYNKNVHKAFVNGKWVEVPKNKKEEIEDKSLIKVSASGIFEVDLHASALLDTTIGMGNFDILNYQLDKFNEAMRYVIKKRGQKIVFIHGKGDGVLRKAILNELKNKYSNCKWQDASFKEYGFGATMVVI